MPETRFDSSQLKQKHRDTRDAQPEALRVRVHRALSWLQRAEQEHDDADAQFLFLWIAFNAAYASEFGFEHSERDQSTRFMDNILARDAQGRLQDVLHRQFSGPIRTLVDNKFVFEPFWKAMREHDASNRWEAQFSASKRRAMQAIVQKETGVLLGIVMDRLHVLRNQMVHGGATWASAANRGQMQDAVAILSTILPVVIDVLIDARTDDFGGIAYPRLP